MTSRPNGQTPDLLTADAHPTPRAPSIASIAHVYAALMLRRVLLGAVGIALLASACSSSGSQQPPLSPDDLPATVPTAAPAPVPEPTTALPAPEPTATTPVPDPGSAPALNRLVILDASGNVAVIDPDGGNRLVLADVSEAGSPNYFQPSWSPTGDEIAWSRLSASGSSLDISRYDGSQKRTALMLAPPFYMNWSLDGTRIAALHSSADGGIDLQIIDVTGSSGTVTMSGVPFYFSWRPDAEALVAHVGSVNLFTIDRVGRSNDLGTTSAEYLAPQWTTDGIIHLDGGKLTLIGPNLDERVLATAPGPVEFVAAPDGSKVAIQAIAPLTPGVAIQVPSVPELPANVVVVLDVATGAMETLTTRSSIGFFWSPDGQRLLIHEPSETPSSVDVSVWDGIGAPRRIVTYQPDFSFVRDVLRYFNQYAQSYQPWSPDSTEFALAGQIALEPGIWVLPADGSEPRLVAEGTWVAWSPR